MRLFVAVDLDYPEGLREFASKLRATGLRMKLVEPENFHVTLRFIGEAGQEAVGTIERGLRRACEGLEPFEVSLRGLGAFPRPERARVLWVAVHGEEIYELARRVNEALDGLGIPGDRKEFVAHATIARVKERPSRRVLDLMEEWKDREFGTQLVSEVRLKKSTLTPRGPVYEDLVVVQLR